MEQNAFVGLAGIEKILRDAQSIEGNKKQVNLKELKLQIFSGNKIK
jgi:hypothetical protein